MTLLQPIGLAIMPIWAYQGIEKIKLMSAVNVVSRIIIIGIFYFYIEKLNIYQTCILFSSQWIITGFIFHILNRSCMKMSLIFHIKNLLSSFLDRLHAAKYLYLTNVCIFLYTFLSILIISSILKSDEFNMVFTLDKYLKTILGFLVPLMTTFIPVISRDLVSSKSHTVKKLYNIMFQVIKFCTLIIVPFNILYYNIFDAWEFGLIPMAYTLIFLPICLNSIFGVLGLVGSGNNIELFKAIFPAAILNLVLIYPAVTYFGLIGGLAMMLFTECLVSIRLIIRIKKLINE
jgi:PST family polysaccharide transporter